MKCNAYTLPAIILLLSTGIIACNNSPSIKAEKADEASFKLVTAEAALDQAKLDSATAYLRFKEQTEATLAENEQKMTELAEKMKTKKEDIRTQYENDLEQLKKENEKLKRSMEDFSYGTNKNWEDFKSAIMQDIDKIGKSISELAEKADKKS